ncbi:carbon storage regulator CsrA [Sulfurimonas marina]|uniref:Translational regulator CsrA n=1 Tax=Sulfurimonas marina TaxID=2590551 RepID=A0A7M1AWQ6_9BACT|nr:carbon storage regulator CsrA [Sulfurimonas marina]QOP41901.1 carbon storage regulator CsrA [Sulfurimonas marina]
MLVLARKVDESIVIGDNIVVKVVAVENGVVKLGIDAPKDVAILRDELAREVALSNKAALHKSDEDELKSLGKLLGK